MALVTLHNVTKQFGSHVVLREASLDLFTGQRVGLVGANGAGKTTLFRLITGELQPDLGTVSRARRLTMGHLRQDPDMDPERTLYQEVARAFAELAGMEEKLRGLSERIARSADDPGLAGLMAEYERINTAFLARGGHRFEVRINEILGGLGFAPREHGRAVGTLSGGQRCRAALARVLLEDAGLLLLDEPTNHLDIAAIEWLEGFLSGHRGGAVVISHDRYLLDRLCERVVEIEDARITAYPGNYSNYVQTKERNLLARERQFEKDREFIAKEQAFIEKHIARQRSAEAKGRRTRLARRMEAGEFVTEKAAAPSQTRIRFEPAAHSTDAVVRCEDVAMRFDDRALFSGLRFQVGPGQRFGITGPNGTGKTTLLRILLGAVSPSEGTVKVDRSLKLGYYVQDPPALEPARTVLDTLRSCFSGMSELEARSYLARYLFRGDDVFKPAGRLSGGEQSRLRLAMLVWDRPDVLVLDEPTNHLDIPSREALESALCEYSGTVIVVSHDRYFLDRIAERLLVLGRDGHEVFSGNYSDYIRTIRARQESAAGRQRRSRSGPAQREAKRAPDRAGSATSRYNHLSVEDLEAMVIDREVELAALQERFADPALYKDPDSLAELKEEIERVETELAEVDAAWQERVDAGQG